MNPASDFMHPDRDRVISFVRDAAGLVRFDVLTRFEPLEFEGLQPVYWRKIHRSEPYANEDAAFAAARRQFAWVEAGWREVLRI
jgi:hypothetical protein